MTQREASQVFPAGYLLESLTRWSYFPTQKKESEYVPAFHSSKFTPQVAQELSAIKYTADQRLNRFDQVEFRLTRHNSATRPLSIPHPLPYSKLCVILDENAQNITQAVDIYSNPNSMIKPGYNASGKLVVMDYEDPLEKSERLIGHAFGKRFRVTTDITNCFPSIYTHALPWALVGVGEAKKFQHDNSAWFNKIDAGYRGIKRGETQGLGIGPAVSNLGAEIILARIDETLSKKYQYFRYIDDYTCWCETHEKAVDFIQDLDALLRSFKLTINTKKTSITELPAPIYNEWIVDLQSRSPISFLNKHDGEVLSFQHTALDAIKHLELALDLNAKDPDGSIIKYAVRMIANNLNEYASEPVTHYVLNLSFLYPHLLPLLEGLLDSPNVDASKYSSHLNIIARENCGRNRSDGICWPLYYLHKFSLQVEAETVSAVLKSKDCTGILLLEHFVSLQGCSIPFLHSLTIGYDRDRYWLLIYQMLKWGRLGLDFMSPEFEVMLKHDVSYSYIDASSTEGEVKFEHDKIKRLFDGEPVYYRSDRS